MAEPQERSTLQQQGERAAVAAAGAEQNLAGKLAIVTGATSGLGYETAVALAERGAHVVFGIRNLTKGQKYLQSLMERVPDAKASLPGVPLDTSSQQSVRDFAGWFLQQQEPLQVLVNNAGVSYMDEGFTNEGVAVLAQTNYLGPYTLTRLLEGHLVASAPSRVVMVSSVTHRLVRIEDPHRFLTNPRYGRYEHTKLADAMFAFELQRRLGSRGVQACAADPGGVRTSIWEHSWILRKPPISTMVKTFFASPEDGAQSLIHAATCDWEANFPFHAPDSLPPEQDFRYFAKGMLASPFITRFTGEYDSLSSLASSSLYRMQCTAQVCLDYPLRYWSGGKLASRVMATRASPYAYDTELSADLWDVSAQYARLPKDPIL